MEETPEGRRQRIAKLRQQRLQKQQGVSHSTLVVAPSDTQTATQPQNQEVQTQTGSHIQPQEEINEQPILTISATETVEIASKEIQNKILFESKQIADSATQIGDLPEHQKRSSVYNKDLKDSLSSQLKLAELRTNKSINSFLQDKINRK